MSDPDAPEKPGKPRLQPRNFGKKRHAEQKDSKKLKLDQTRRGEIPKTPVEAPAPSLRDPAKSVPPPPPPKPAKAEFFINPGRGGVPLFKEEVQRKLDRDAFVGKIGTRRTAIIALVILLLAGVGVWWMNQQTPSAPIDSVELAEAEIVSEPVIELAQPTPPPAIEEILPMAAVQEKLAPYQGRLEALQAEGNDAEIEKVFREAAAEISNLPLFWLQMGVLYYTHLRSGDETNAVILEKANPFFQRAMRFGSELPVVLAHASTYFVETGQIDAGLKALKRLSELRPTDSGVLQQLAFTQTATGRTDEAISTIQQMMAIDPGDVRTRLAYANLLEEAGRIEDAAEAYRVYLSLNPGDISAILKNAQLLKSNGRMEGARGTLERAIQSHPDDVNLQANYAVLLLESKDYAGALEAFDAAKKLVPPDAPPRMQATLFIGQGSAYYEMGELGKAEELFAEAYRLTPEGNPDASNNLAYIWAQQSKNLAEAMRMAERNVQEMPENPSYRHTLALALFRQGQSKAALEHLEVAFENSQEPSRELLETLGDVNASLGANEEAQRFYAKALALAPENEALRAKIVE